MPLVVGIGPTNISSDGRHGQARKIEGRRRQMRTAIYARVSTSRQAREQSIDQQVQRLKTHAQREGWALEAEHVYLDDGYSAASLNRPGLDALRDAAMLAASRLPLDQSVPPCRARDAVQPPPHTHLLPVPQASPARDAAAVT
jgi:hypothetical protein